MSRSPKRQGPPISFLPVSCNTEKRHEETAPLGKKKKPFAAGSSRKGYLGYPIWGGFRGVKDQDRADQEGSVWSHGGGGVMEVRCLPRSPLELQMRALAPSFSRSLLPTGIFSFSLSKSFCQRKSSLPLEQWVRESLV